MGVGASFLTGTVGDFCTLLDGAGGARKRSFSRMLLLLLAAPPFSSEKSSSAVAGSAWPVWAPTRGVPETEGVAEEARLTVDELAFLRLGTNLVVDLSSKVQRGQLK